MYARFLGGPAMQGSWFRCGISPGLARFTAVWSLNRPPAARAPLLGGGPARRQPLPPQGADATTLMSLRPVKVLESLGLIFLDGHCWPGASLSAKAPRNWVYPGFPTLFWGLSGFFVNDLMGKALWSSWKTRSVFQGAVGAFCASTAPSASTGPICMRQDRRVLGLQSTRE